MITRRVVMSLLAGTCVTLGAVTARAEGDDQATLLRALQPGGITLEEGLKTSETVGVPISAKFEVEDGRLQLSVYVTDGDGYREIVIAPETGVLMSAQGISGAEDLADAARQKDAMQAAKQSLLAATARACAKAHQARAVSALPELQTGQAIAAITLLDGGQFRTVRESMN